jgi:tetratricopeptide (TPR) repeat protein
MDNFARSEKCKVYVKSMYAIAKKHKNKPVLMWRSMYWDAFWMWKSSKETFAISIANKAIKLVDTVKYEYDYRRIQRLLLNCIVDKKTYFESYKEYKKSLCYFTKVDDTLNIANNCVTIGNIFQELGEPNKAYDYLHRADSLYRLCNQKTYLIKNKLNIANVLNSKGERKKAIQTLLWATRQEDVKNDTVFMLQVYASLSSASNNIKLTEFYSRKAYRLAKKYRDEELLMQASLNMGAVYVNTNKSDSALLFYRKVWTYLQRNKNNRFLLPTLGGMANSFWMQERWDSAYIYLNKFLIYQKSLRKAGNLSEVYRQESRAAIDNYEATLARQQAEAMLHRIVLILILAVVVLVCGFACYGFWSQRRKALAKKRIQELENKELATRLKNEELQFELEMDSKNRELVSNSLMLIEKNQMLDELLQRIDNGGDAGQITRSTVIELKNQIRAHASEEDEWHKFRAHFEQVHPGFFIRLKEMHPALTEYELRLCAYIRTGMYGKQIAMMLSVQPDSIKKSRTRLRKKLRLRQEDSLEDFLRGINKREDDVNKS